MRQEQVRYTCGYITIVGFLTKIVRAEWAGLLTHFVEALKLHYGRRGKSKDNGWQIAKEKLEKDREGGGKEMNGGLGIRSPDKQVNTARYPRDSNSDPDH